MEDKLKMTQVRIIMPEEYRRLFKALCVEQGTDMSKYISSYIKEELIKAGKINPAD
jgi:ferredoxin-fold anticodon binding domain-containing protein